MAQLIRFADNVLVEIAANSDRAQPVAGRTAEKVGQAFQAATDTIGAVLKSVISTTTRAVRDAGATDCEIEFGMAFSVEGWLYLAQVGTEGSISVKVRIDATKAQ
jgi:hypothetical protein